MKISVKIYLFFLLVSCASNKQIVSSNLNLKTRLIKDQLKTWHFKDIIKDSIPGISLERAYQELIKNKKGKEIVVAVIDTQIDINHEDLKQAIWINPNETPNNGIDDDNNGYIDDINGWNFIGNSKGESVFDSNFEYVRIIKKYNNFFNNKAFNSIKESIEFKLYKQAKERLKKEIKNIEYSNYSMDYSIKYLDSIKKVLKPYFPNNNYTIENLGNIQAKDVKIIDAISKMQHFIKKGWSVKYFNSIKDDNQKYYKFNFNTNYNDRELIGDNENDITDVNYGNNHVGIIQSQKIYHATYVGGVLNANRNNNLGAKGVYDKIKIMPLSISSNGDENDKDIALAIYYAVNNGAQVINMSSSKEFSIHSGWVRDALLYAEKHNVLFITSAANSGYNIDKNIVYPNDIDNFGNEILDNFICVGANTPFANKNMIATFSNFGKNNVDVFAPGKDIYTTVIDNQYEPIDGTSMATPIVSGVAALIMSYYPKLKASEVKEIILASGVSYDMDVEIKGEDGKKKLVPFKSLSKSGKIVNSYNALILAKHYKQWKKGKWKM